MMTSLIPACTIRSGTDTFQQELIDTVNPPDSDSSGGESSSLDNPGKALR